MAELERNTFDIVIYKKGQIFEAPKTMCIMGGDFHHKMKELEGKMIIELERSVIANGLMTTYSGIHIIAFSVKNAGKPVLLIVYKPTLNYMMYSDARHIKEELDLLETFKRPMPVKAER